MLVLSRKLGQRIFIPHLGLMVTVVALTGGKVRLGFEAPPGVTVWREEILWGTDEPVGHCGDGERPTPKEERRR